MSESITRTLNHFGVWRFRESFWDLAAEEREKLLGGWLAGMREAAQMVELYQVFPMETRGDVMVWSALPAEESEQTALFFDAVARATNRIRAHLELTDTLWGFTRASQYSRAQRSTQEIDPFADARKRYLVMYPFVKTADWYLLGRETRQGMMNEHIRIGKQFEEISQLLLYSFGLQDQEFVVVYEMDDIRRFSDLVEDLRRTEARRYTERDTPLHAGIWRPAEEILALWK